MSNSAVVNRGLALYNAPPYPYNTLEDIESVNIGFGKKKRRVGRGKRKHTGKGRVVHRVKHHYIKKGRGKK
jgi:hypothetical protein